MVFGCIPGSDFYVWPPQIVVSYMPSPRIRTETPNYLYDNELQILLMSVPEPLVMISFFLGPKAFGNITVLRTAELEGNGSPISVPSARTLRFSFGCLNRSVFVVCFLVFLSFLVFSFRSFLFIPFRFFSDFFFVVVVFPGDVVRDRRLCRR